LNSSIPIYDSTTEKFLKKNSNNTNEIPEGAVVISGSRRLSTKSGMKNGISITKSGMKNGISIYCPVIIKYRDEKTGSSINLEELLR